MTKEVMQQALEALENAVRYHGIMLMADPPQDAWKYHRVEDNAKQAITAIKEALAQPVQPVQEQSCFCHSGVSLQIVSGGAAPEGYLGTVTLLIDGVLVDYAKAQPEQKPVACRFCHDKKGSWAWQCYKCGEIDDVQQPAPQRPWQGLTEFQFAEIYNAWNDTNGSTPWGLNQALEAKLRKLNK